MAMPPTPNPPQRQPTRPSPPLVRYGLALLIAGLTVAIRWWLEPLVGSRHAFLGGNLAVALVAYRYGTGPAVAALAAIGVAFFGLFVVPTADLSTTLGMSVSVLLICLFYNVKIKGIGGWLHELTTAPFGAHPLLWPINFGFQMIEFLAKTVSHGMRLFGNMYAGELIFMLIALMGSAAAMSLSGILLPIAHIIAGSIWAVFHILIVALQAFIFMMLTLVYIGQAHDTH